MEIQNIRENSRASVFSGEGIRLIQASKNLGKIALEFCDYKTDTDRFLTGYPYVGSGNNGVVWNADNVAVKISNRSSGKKNWKNHTSQKPENLIDQFNFLSIFRKYLENETDGAICTPVQFFALKNNKGEFLKAEELMSDWVTISEVSSNNNLGRNDNEIFLTQTKNRINKILGSSAIKLGLNDVGLDRNDLLHGGNVMMPKNTVNMDSPKICLIDQPAKGLQGKLMLALIKVRK